MLDLNPVYNYYHTVYSPKAHTKYESHKKEDLKQIYQSIVKSGKESPLYKVDFTSKIQSYALGIKNAAIQLNYNTQMLSDRDDDAFSKLSASSENPEAVGATVITTDYDRLPQKLDVTVDQVATSQQNIGNYLYTDHLGLKADNYSFTTKVDNQTYNFNFAIHSEDTNLKVQKKLTNFINQADIGIHAYIDQQGKKSALVLESDETGTASDSTLYFSIMDDHSESGIVSTYGLNQVTREPVNAIFSINGQDREAPSNLVAINQLVELELKEPTNEPVPVNFIKDTQSVLNKLHEFTDSYNQVIDYAKEHDAGQRSSKKLSRELANISKRHESTLESLGFVINENGTIQTDDALLSQNIASGDMQKLFEDISGFQRDLKNRTQSISLDPMNYVDKTMISYKNPKQSFANPYMTSIYSGMLYNGYV